MFLIQQADGAKKEAVTEPVTSQDYKSIKKGKRFQFKWDSEKQNEVYKLRLSDSNEILGLMSLIEFNNWIKINLLESSEENVGKEKQYDRIAGCLIAYACRLAFVRGYDGVVALEPKTELAKHYMQKYGFQIAGIHIYTELRNSEALINEYLRLE
jgi:hypothetical protein